MPLKSVHSRIDIRAVGCSEWVGTPRYMKPATPPEPACEPLWTFRCPNFGYDIALVPHSERDRIRLKRQAKRKGMSLADFARDEILGVITLGFREEATPHEHENRS